MRKIILLLILTVSCFSVIVSASEMPKEEKQREVQDRLLEEFDFSEINRVLEEILPAKEQILTRCCRNF